MGLYLAVFDGEVEIDGVEVGSYSDFDAFRSAVTINLEGGIEGVLFPTLILHSDCDGEWGPSEARCLEAELKIIRSNFQSLAPTLIPEGWKAEVAALRGLRPRSLYDCYFDIDGESLIERICGLARISYSKQLPIVFQ